MTIFSLSGSVQCLNPHEGQSILQTPLIFSKWLALQRRTQNNVQI